MPIKRYEPEEQTFHIKWIIYIAVIFAVFIVALAANPIVQVPAGSRGILLRFGAVSRILPEGLSFKTPFIEDTRMMSVRTQITTTDASAASKNLQDVTATIAVNYHATADQEGVAWLFKNVGYETKDFEGLVVAPSVQESIKAVTAQYTTEELISKRSEVRTKIEELLKEKIHSIVGDYIIIDAVNIINFKFSASYTAAIEAKATAEQTLGEQQRQLEIIKVQAQQAVAQAQGAAEAKVAAATAEAKSVQLINEQLKQSPAYVQYIIASKWDGKLPQYILGGGTLPFINIPTSTSVTTQ